MANANVTIFSFNYFSVQYLDPISTVSLLYHKKNMPYMLFHLIGKRKKNDGIDSNEYFFGNEKK